MCKAHTQTRVLTQNTHTFICTHTHIYIHTHTKALTGSGRKEMKKKKVIVKYFWKFIISQHL